MKNMNLCQLRKNVHGVSVVIGALMLTLIVVTAAVSFAVFTAQKQEELQKAEYAELLRELEEIDIGKIVDLDYDINGELSTIDFNIASKHTRSSEIVVMKLNDNIISDFQVTSLYDDQTQGWSLSGKYYRTAYFANDSSSNYYIFDDLNGNHKKDDGEEVLDDDPDDNGIADPKTNDQGYVYAIDNNNEPYLFNDTDFDGIYTTSLDILVDGNGNDPPTYNSGSINTFAVGKDLSLFTDNDNVFANAQINPQVVWIENENNDWYNHTNDILLLNLTGGSVDNTSGTNTSGIQVYNWWNWSYYDENSNGYYDNGEDILIDYMVGGTYSSVKDYYPGFAFARDPDQDSVIAVPSEGDRGGFYPKYDDFTLDSMDQCLIQISNVDDDIIYLLKGEMEEKVKQNNAITLTLQTQLTNSFERLFIPPTANIKVNEETDTIVLDGTDSFSQNASNIVEWEWNLTKMNNGEYLPPMYVYGRKVNANKIFVDYEGVEDYLKSFIKWNVTLKVTDDFGMIGIDNFTHIQDFKPMMAEEEFDSLEIDNFTPEYNDTSGKVKNITFSIKNNYNFDSHITRLIVNNTNYTSDVTVVPLLIYSYKPSTQQKISLSPEIPDDTPISVKFKTKLGNTIEETFYPPTPNFIVNFDYQNIPYLDASSSDQVGDAYLTNWKWNVSKYYVDKMPNGEYDSSGDLNFTWNIDEYRNGRFMFAEDNNSKKFTFLDDSITNYCYDMGEKIVQNISSGTIYHSNSNAYNVSIYTESFTGRKTRADILGPDGIFDITLTLTNNYGLKSRKLISFPY